MEKDSVKMKAEKYTTVTGERHEIKSVENTVFVVKYQKQVGSKTYTTERIGCGRNG